MPRIFKAVSIVIHALVIAVASFVQIFSVGALPTPRSVLAFDATPIVVVDGLGTVQGGLGDLGPLTRSAPPPPPAPAPRVPVRLHSGMSAPRKVLNVDPIYPAPAQAARKEGIVILEAVIDAAGSVASVRVLRSIPLLDQAAVGAVQQWRFTPALLNGEPVPVVMTVTVTFALED